MVTLLPRLPAPAAEILLEQQMLDGFAAWPGFDHHALPAAVRFAATGGSQVSPNQPRRVSRAHIADCPIQWIGRYRHSGFSCEV